MYAQELRRCLRKYCIVYSMINMTTPSTRIPYPGVMKFTIFIKLCLSGICSGIKTIFVEKNIYHTFMKRFKTQDPLSRR